mmetsp:Transcript_27616/g.91729  ORF Transcript_27616/g.91729 Transcript_27616/m.91729 type:complete len:251 (-) Transcript_27616:804-1556(-)
MQMAKNGEVPCRKFANNCIEHVGFENSPKATPTAASSKSKEGLQRLRCSSLRCMTGLLDAALPPEEPPLPPPSSKPDGGPKSNLFKNSACALPSLPGAAPLRADDADVVPEVGPEPPDKPKRNLTCKAPLLLAPSPAILTRNSPSSPPSECKKGFRPQKRRCLPPMLGASAAMKGLRRKPSPKFTVCRTCKSGPDLSTNPWDFAENMNLKVSGSLSSCWSPCRRNSAVQGCSAPAGMSMRKVRMLSVKSP